MYLATAIPGESLLTPQSTPTLSLTFAPSLSLTLIPNHVPAHTHTHTHQGRLWRLVAPF